MKSIRAWALSENLSPRTAQQICKKLVIGESIGNGLVIILTEKEWSQVKSNMKSGRGRPRSEK